MTTEHADGRPEAEGTPSPAGEGAARAARRPGETDDLDGLSPEELRERVREAQAEAQRNWQQFLHSAADLENYKKLAIRDRQDAVERTRREVLGVALGILDNLERALAFGTGHDGGGKALVDGLRMAHRQMLDQLAAIGVRPIESVGKPFDPRLHEAVGIAPPQGRGQAPGTVVAEVLRGYRLNDDILRPAKVTVASEREGGAREG
ncbi:MAG TPA: nucleotide exchange factor GrpE [bacterium]|nr:nucleotide exchange factor GrpE [bacterium]